MPTKQMQPIIDVRHPFRSVKFLIYPQPSSNNITTNTSLTQHYYHNNSIEIPAFVAINERALIIFKCQVGPVSVQDKNNAAPKSQSHNIKPFM